MGGPGSGFGRSGASNLVEYCRHLDIRRLQADPFLSPGSCFRWQWRIQGRPFGSVDVQVGSGQMILIYYRLKSAQEWELTRQAVMLEATPGTYGGSRTWFLCPNAGCGRRVAILYARPYLACRHCCGLIYKSSCSTRADRLFEQAEKIRERLGWEPGVLSGHGGKPKWMRWKTFDRLVQRHEMYAEWSLYLTSCRFGFTGEAPEPFKLPAYSQKRSA